MLPISQIFVGYLKGLDKMDSRQSIPTTTTCECLELISPKQSGTGAAFALAITFFVTVTFAFINIDLEMSMFCVILFSRVLKVSFPTLALCSDVLFL